MKELLFTFQGRINRKKLWFAFLIQLLAAAAVGVIMTLLWQVDPGTVGEDGTFHVEGTASIPYFVVGIAYMVFAVWSGLAVSIKRVHDRNKSGWFILIQFIPLIGAIWFFIEAYLLKGTTGPNRFGEDPLATA